MRDSQHIQNLGIIPQSPISGFEHIARLLDEGLEEEARDLYISCKRAEWMYRWQTERSYTLERLGQALDRERFPGLAPIAEALTADDPGAAGRFLEWIRARSGPDLSPYVLTPEDGLHPLPANSHGPWCDRLWQIAVATGTAEARAALDASIAAILDPHVVITWHETNYPWGRLVASALVHGGIDDETLCKLILFGLDHAEHCNNTVHFADPAQPSIGGNHYLYWIMGWMTSAAMFPEFRRGPALLSAAIARLEDELSKQVAPDGIMVEGSPGYQNCCLDQAGHFLRLAEHLNLTFPESVHTAWRRMLHACIGLMKPNGRVPMFGDSQADEVRLHGAAVARHYNEPEFRWLLSEGREGAPPAHTSAAFPCSGYYIMRTGWEEDDLCLAFDGGRLGQAHYHEDKLSFELMAYGRPLIVDTGVHSYSDHWFRAWSCVSQSHNVILVDGVGQCRWREDRNDWYSHVPLTNPWTTGERWDEVEADFTGPYESEIGPLTQTRRITFHRGEPPFWIITDTVTGEGSHEITELFHLAHDIEEVEMIEGGVRTRIPGGPDLLLLSLDADSPPVFSVHRGEMDPPRGWISPELGSVEPAWEIHVATTAALPLTRRFILLPWQGELPQTIAAELADEGQRLALTVGERSWSIGLSRDQPCKGEEG
ncbi:MAG: alginate lyase family protein [Planctomycetota bacterium]|jgi:hypothetical protein